jgi:hypothetical protein
MYIYLLIAWGAFFSACMDTFENTPNFDKGIFKHLDKRWWCKDISCNYVKLFFGYRPDSWHITKSLMWGCIIAAAIVAWYSPVPKWPWPYHFVGLGITWNIVFPLYYNVIFRIK